MKTKQENKDRAAIAQNSISVEITQIGGQRLKLKIGKIPGFLDLELSAGQAKKLGQLLINANHRIQRAEIRRLEERASISSIAHMNPQAKGIFQYLFSKADERG